MIGPRPRSSESLAKIGFHLDRFEHMNALVDNFARKQLHLRLVVHPMQAQVCQRASTCGCYVESATISIRRWQRLALALIFGWLIFVAVASDVAWRRVRHIGRKVV
jgi:hypothetical protein